MKFLERAFDQQNQFWKYLLTFLGSFFGGQIIGCIPLFFILIVKVASSNGDIALNPDNMMDFTGLGISKNWSLFLMMLAPACCLLLLILLVKAFHKRTFSETVNGTKKIRTNRCLMGALVWGILMVIYLVADHIINPGNYNLQFNLTKFIPLLFISIILIPLQTTFEELLFRGYLAQGVAVWTKNRWLAILIPGFIFGLIHSFNPEVKEFGFWATMPQYIFFGLLFGFVAVLDDGIELSMGMHAVNNVFLSLFITSKSSVLQTDAVFEQININPSKETLVLVIMGIIAVIYFAWKYKWNLGILNTKIEKQIEENI